MPNPEKGRTGWTGTALCLEVILGDRGPLSAHLATYFLESQNHLKLLLPAHPLPGHFLPFPSVFRSLLKEGVKRAGPVAWAASPYPVPSAHGEDAVSHGAVIARVGAAGTRGLRSAWSLVCAL